MERSALLALALATAALAFALGAATFAPTVPATDADDPGEVTPPNETTQGSTGNGTAGSAGAGSDGQDAGCGSCGPLDLRSTIAGLLPSVDPRLLVGVLGIVVLGLAATGLRSGTTPDDLDESDPTAVDSAVAAAPTATATERHLDAPPTNDVFRAWRSMVDHTDVEHPDATPPRAYARRAIAAGAPAAPVERLTHLFERVRYGGAAASADRERRARTAADRVAEEWGGSDPQGGTDQRVEPSERDDTDDRAATDAGDR